MTAQSKTTIKSYFQTSDRPTESQFADLIDSYIDTQSAIGNAQTLASAGGTGIVNITSPSSASLVTSGTVGLQIFQTNTTAAAQQALGGGTVGRNLFQAVTTAAAFNQLGSTTVGAQIFIAATTAAANNALGGGTVGIQIFQAVTTAAAQNIIGAGVWTYGSANATSGSTVDITGIPTGVSEIEITPAAISTTGTNNLFLQIGDAGGLETTGYTGGVTEGGSIAAAASGWRLTFSMQAAWTLDGAIRLSRGVSNGTLWSILGAVYNTSTNGSSFSGNKALSAELDRFSILTADSFDSSGVIYYRYR